ncbi:MAG: YdbL family protein [Opitutaceae bacterium]
MKTLWIRFLFASAAFVFAAATITLFAEDLSVVKQRMAQRLPAVDALKDRGLVGENNRGYLEARGSLSGDEGKMVSAENTDRATVYAAVARQTGSSSDQVGRTRARQIGQNSKSGVWLQDESGHWYQKR